MISVITSIITKVAYVWFILFSIGFGFSLAFNKWISSLVSKIQNESNKNYLKIEEKYRIEIDKYIENAKLEYRAYKKTTKKNFQIEKFNKVRKIFHLEEKEVKPIDYTFKDIVLNLMSGVSFKENFLSFSANDIYYILTELTKRIKSIIASTKILWLKDVNLSFLLLILDYYSRYKDIKNKLLIIIAFDLINFLTSLYRFINPIGAVKYLIKNVTGDERDSKINDSIIEVLGKELASIYDNMAKEKTSVEEIEFIQNT